MVLEVLVEGVLPGRSIDLGGRLSVSEVRRE